MRRKNVGKIIKKSLPTMLSICASIGVIGTAVLVGKASYKAGQKSNELDEMTGSEIIKEVGKDYIPSITVAAATIASIIASNKLNKKQYANLACAFALLKNYHNNYSNEVIKRHGIEEDLAIKRELVCYTNTYHQIDSDIPDSKLTWQINGHFIDRYEREIIDAEMQFNRNFVLRGYTSLSELYEFLGITPFDDENEDELGWAVFDGDYYWVDFEHCPQNDGTILISTVFPPDENYIDY